MELEQILFCTLRWVTDAVAILNKFNLDWDIIIERSNHFHFTPELHIAFTYLSEKFTNKIPPSFLKKINDLPITDQEIKTYYRFANVVHTHRYSALGNFPMFWYAYWKLESGPKNLFGLFNYLRNAFGVKNTPELLRFIFKEI
jgi:hypothetical protein